MVTREVLISQKIVKLGKSELDKSELLITQITHKIFILSTKELLEPINPDLKRK